MRFLVESGGPVDAQDKDGVTPTHLAARNGHKKMLRMLIFEVNSLKAL